MDDDGFELATAGQRLRWARPRAGFQTAKAAAKAARINAVSFRAYENDQHGLTKHASHLARTFGVPVEWLVDGEGAPGDLRLHDRHLAYHANGPVAETDTGQEIEFVRKVDITYAMGDGSIIEDYPETEFIPFNLQFPRQFAKGPTARLFIATGHGDSMEPTLRRDDLVMIDGSQNRIAHQDQIWAISYAGAGMIKRVRRLSGGRLQILSDNTSVPSMDAAEDEVYVVGKVVWSARLM